ncbi:MAG TPA: hypothetical protein VMX16_01340 [Terriglobia bacterium]|nr:hypothetical protein [Terriglobia bacterium]
MKVHRLVGNLIFMAFAIPLSTALGGQDQKPTLNKPDSSQRPSLGSAAPSLNGPTNATIIDAHQLIMVHRVYIEFMDNHLNLKLDQALAKQGPFQVASSRDEADAILRGTCFDSPHLKDVHSEVFLTTKAGKAIWQDVIRRPYNPPALSQVVAQTANMVVMQLRESVEVARRR